MSNKLLLVWEHWRLNPTDLNGQWLVLQHGSVWCLLIKSNYQFRKLSINLTPQISDIFHPHSVCDCDTVTKRCQVKQRGNNTVQNMCVCVSHLQIQHFVQCSVHSLQHWDLSEPNGWEDGRQQTAATQGEKIHPYKYCCTEGTHSEYSQSLFSQTSCSHVKKHISLTRVSFLLCNCVFLHHTIVAVDWTSASILQYSETQCVCVAAGQQTYTAEGIEMKPPSK